jgi:hypothetical protein
MFVTLLLTVTSSTLRRYRVLVGMFGPHSQHRTGGVTFSDLQEALNRSTELCAHRDAVNSTNTLRKMLLTSTLTTRALISCGVVSEYVHYPVKTSRDNSGKRSPYLAVTFDRDRFQLSAAKSSILRPESFPPVRVWPHLDHHDIISIQERVLRGESAAPPRRERTSGAATETSGESSRKRSSDDGGLDAPVDDSRKRMRTPARQPLSDVTGARSNAPTPSASTPMHANTESSSAPSKHSSSRRSGAKKRARRPSRTQ